MQSVEEPDSQVRRGMHEMANAGDTCKNYEQSNTRGQGTASVT